MLRNFAKENRSKTAQHRNRLVNRLLPIETLESRQVLSALSLIDYPPEQHNSVHHCDLETSGYIYHALPLPVGELESTPAAGDGSPAATAPLEDTFRLHSNPGSLHTIFLDFDGLTTSGQIWNNAFNGGADFVTPAYSFTGDASFADSELARIQTIWQRVAEDFIPFDVNVTTEEPSSDALIKSGSGDATWGVRVAIGGNGSWYGGGAGGVAYVGSFNWSSDTPVFVFEDNLGNGAEKYTAEAISHEAGHALGLNHDGRTSPQEEYYQGQGSGATGWAPILGNGYYRPLTQWSRGEYTAASNVEDDLLKITSNNGFSYRADDHGNDLSSASVLSATQGTVATSGIIERNDDFDVFTFLTDAGSISLDVLPFERGPNLDIAAALFDATGELLVSSNPFGSLSAQLSATLAAGQYFVQVTGVGEGDPQANGYSDYGSLGSYSISGSVVQTNASYLSIAAQSADLIEGDSGTKLFTFLVTRSGDVSGPAEVSWSVGGSSGSPAEGDDFNGGILPGGLLQFAAGETFASISVAVSGDLTSEEDEVFTVVLSGASGGALITTSTAYGTIRNDDAAPIPPGITVTPTSGLTTSERGASASFSVVLDSAPQFDVVIPISSNDLTEGVVDLSSLRFTSDNWNVAQIVTVTGVDDSLRDRSVTYVVRLGTAQSSDSDYSGFDADDVQVTNQDDERGGGGGKKSGDGGGKGKKNRAPKAGQAVFVDWVADRSTALNSSSVSVSAVASQFRGGDSNDQEEFSENHIDTTWSLHESVLASYANQENRGEPEASEFLRYTANDEGQDRSEASDSVAWFDAQAIDLALRDLAVVSVV